MLLDRNSLWLACEPLGEDATLRAERAQAAVRKASAAKAAQTTAVGAVAASPPANAPAASPIVETGVVPVAQEQRESSVVRCCHGHGMQRRVFPKYQIIICAMCNTGLKVPEKVSLVERASGWFCEACYSQSLPAWRCDPCSEM